MKAVVLNDNLTTLGGGERLTLSYALALQTLGYEVSVVSRKSLPEERAWRNLFGSEFESIPIRRVAKEAFSTWVADEAPEVFVNNSHLDTTPNPGRVGIYSVMFPSRPYRRRSEPRALQGLDTYDCFACLTEFVRMHTRTLWEVPAERLRVVLPPIGKEFIERARTYTAGAETKQKRLLHVGRFNPAGHNKNQKLLIEEFVGAVRDCPELREWEFHLVGTVNHSHGGERYFDECRQAAEGFNIHFHPGLPYGEMLKLMEGAFGYVHGTGAFLPPGLNPEFCEHYGLSILEAMACGCIPLVYGRGGIFDVLDAFRGGIPYMTPEGLRGGFRLFDQLYHTPAAERMVLRNLQSLEKVGHACFRKQIQDILTTSRPA